MIGQNHTSFRALTAREKQILETLLAHHPFNGRDELLKQVESTTARLIAEFKDNYGSIELRVAGAPPCANWKSFGPIDGR